MKTNPLWNVQRDQEDFIRERLKNSWDYYKITKRDIIGGQIRNKMKNIEDKIKRHEKILDDERITDDEKKIIYKEKMLINDMIKDAYTNL